jgi:hypothetical protein
VYNLRIAGTHTFYIGNGNGQFVLVHNESTDGTTAPGIGHHPGPQAVLKKAFMEGRISSDAYELGIKYVTGQTKSPHGNNYYGGLHHSDYNDLAEERLTRYLDGVKATKTKPLTDVQMKDFIDALDKGRNALTGRVDPEIKAFNQAIRDDLKGKPRTGPETSVEEIQSRSIGGNTIRTTYQEVLDAAAGGDASSQAMVNRGLAGKYGKPFQEFLKGASSKVLGRATGALCVGTAITGELRRLDDQHQVAGSPGKRYVDGTYVFSDKTGRFAVLEVPEQWLIFTLQTKYYKYYLGRGDSDKSSDGGLVIMPSDIDLNETSFLGSPQTLKELEKDPAISEITKAQYDAFKTEAERQFGKLERSGFLQWIFTPGTKRQSLQQERPRGPDA